MNNARHNRRFIKKVIFTCLVLLIVIATQARAQNYLPVNATRNDRTSLFHQSPDSIAIDATILNALFAKTTNTQVALKLHDNMQLDGTVEEVTEKYNGLITALRVKLTNYPGAVLFFSQTLLPAGNYQYRCLIAGKEIQDGYFAISDSPSLLLLKRNINSLRNE